jgi:DNA-binding transcriptional MerR regulator
MKRATTKRPTPSLPELEMPDVRALPKNWSLFVEMLRQRRFTSGDVDACIGVSRKVLMDWVRAGILSRLFHGLGSGKGDERFGKWRLFSILDIWTLAFYKRLRDEGISIERLRGLKRKADIEEGFEGEVIQWWDYQALACWVYRQPFWVHTDLHGGLMHTPIERKTAAIYFIQIGHLEPETTDLFLTVNLIPLMDRVMALNGPLQLRLDATKGIIVRIEGHELRLEPLPKPVRN